MENIPIDQKAINNIKNVSDDYLSTLTALVYALEAKDKYISGHSRRVANIAVAIAQELNLPPSIIDKIGIAGLIHDIGKIGVREDILNKQGELTDDEYKHVISHCETGERILRPVIKDEEILDIVRHHHERYDGTGYPDGLSGRKIPVLEEAIALSDTYTYMAIKSPKMKTLSLNASIVSVADAYDAMLCPRSYRCALSREKAAEEIRRGAGSQFHPEAVNALLKIQDSLISFFEAVKIQVDEEAGPLAKEQAKKEAEEARKAKEAEKQAKKQAELLAKEQAKKDAEEARKAKEAEKAEKQREKETEELYEGIVSLLLPSFAGFEQFQEHLGHNDNLRIFANGGTNKGGVVWLSLQEPLPLIKILNRMLIVEKANKKDKNTITVFLKDVLD